MPQFDQFSFFNQVSWFLFFFLNFYFFIIYFFFLKIFYNFKFIKKKIIFNNKKKNKIYFYKNNIIFFLNYYNKIFCSKFELFIIKKLSIYKENQKVKIQQTSLLNNILKKKINFFLNQKFLLFKKVFINI